MWFRNDCPVRVKLSKWRVDRFDFDVHQLGEAVSCHIIWTNRLTGRVTEIWIVLQFQERFCEAAVWLSERDQHAGSYIRARLQLLSHLDTTPFEDFNQPFSFFIGRWW